MRQEPRDLDGANDAPLPALSTNALARCLGVTPKVVYDLAKAGLIERGSARLFPLEESVRRYCEYLRGQLGNTVSIIMVRRRQSALIQHDNKARQYPETYEFGGRSALTGLSRGRSTCLESYWVNHHNAYVLT